MTEREYLFLARLLVGVMAGVVLLWAAAALVANR